MKKSFLIAVLSIFPFLAGCGEDPSANPKDDFKLDAPNISLNSDKLIWEKVPNADYYAVYEKEEIFKYVQENYLNLNITVNGNYEFSVQALTFGLTYESSDLSNKVSYSVNLIELGEPTISINDDYIVWSKVENATNYSLFVDNKAIEEPNFISEDNNIKWKVSDLESSGNHSISVVSLSDVEGYETQSGKSNAIEVYASGSKKWLAEDIATEWKNNGNVSIDNKQLLIDSSSNSVELSNFITVDSIKPYFNIKFIDVEATKETKMYLYMDGEIVKENSSATDYFLIAENSTAVYNFSTFINKIVYIKIVLSQGMKVSVDNFYFTTKNEVSPFDSWNAGNYKEDWSTSGNVNYHDEGICLESSKNSSTITNKIKVENSKPYFTLLLRKFERIDIEDENPESYLYINGQLTAPLGFTYSAMSATSDTPNKYVFDLRDYVNQVVEIKITNVKGEHACFTKMYLSDKGAYSIKTHWGIDLIQEEWDFAGTVEVHKEGVCLHNNGSESSITNKINLSTNVNKLVIEFKKFLRDDEQDKDPKIKVYINNQLVKAVGVEEDYVSVHNGDFHSFAYDLTPYKGEVVTIRIVNTEGEHACFDSIYVE